MIEIDNNTQYQGLPVYTGDTFKIVMNRYSDPHRENLARNAAVYLGKPDRWNTRRPLTIIKRGDVPEIFRGEFVEFEYVDVSKEVYDHLTTYTTRRMRVAGGNRALTSGDFTMPSDRMKNPDLVFQNIQSSMDNYLELLDAGETPQIARSSMPVNAQMNPFILQWNFQTLFESLFSQRLWELGAQGNTVKVVRGMWELVHFTDPELWDTLLEHYGPHVVEMKEAQRKMRKHDILVSGFLTQLQNSNDPHIENRPLDVVLRAFYGNKKDMWE